MSASIFLDHIGIAVRDLASAKADYERLGFAPTPLSLHAAPPAPGAPVEPTGSGNHCIMLRDGYLELIGVVDPAKPSTTRMFLDRYEGPHILALGAKDVAAACQSIARRGFEIGQPVALERDAAWGPAGAETRRAAFANAHLKREGFPEARAFIIEHKTPGVIWQPHQLVHPNGAVALVEAWVCPNDPREAASRYALLAGSEASPVGEDEWTISLDRGRLRILSPKAFTARTSGLLPPAVPGMAGLAVTVRELSRARNLLEGSGIECRDEPDGFVVTSPLTHGTALRFTSAS